MMDDVMDMISCIIAEINNGNEIYVYILCALYMFSKGNWLRYMLLILVSYLCLLL